MLSTINDSGSEGANKTTTEFFLYGRPQTFKNYLEERERYDLFLTETDGEIRQLSPGVEQSLDAVRQEKCN